MNRYVDFSSFRNFVSSWAGFAAIVALLLGVAAPWLIGQVVNVTGVTGITFSTYDLRGQLAGMVDRGNQFANLALQFAGAFTLPGILMTIVGLAVSTAAVAWLLDLLKLRLPARWHIVGVLVVAHVLMGIIISQALPAFELLVWIFLLATGLASVVAVEWLYKLFKWQLPN